ncbi:MAG TPA: RNA polymerase sigma-70 factor [Solirubrobacteraceae bacterium]|nr:RNA polymerase sigma-70 factor [Solirubrobacteraceae bacterium]
MSTGDAYAELRPYVFAIAYRMVGSVSEAEDLVQEAFLRLHRAAAAGERVESPRAYLATVVTRLAIDHLRSARSRRETYVGTWLPEPLVGAGDDVAAQAEQADSLSLAFLVVLETLSPVERAVFLLREVFDFGYDEIAAIVGRSEANCRQIALRARRHVEARRPRFDPSPERREELADRFFAAAQEGDTDALVELLAADVAIYGDGGGRAPALRRPAHGAIRVARLLAQWGRLVARGGVRVERVTVNGQPGLRSFDADGRTVNVLALHVVAGRIAQIHSIINPDKLRHLGPVGDPWAMLRPPESRPGP